MFRVKRFENDVNQYGSYTPRYIFISSVPFENDVNQYGSYTKKKANELYKV